MDLYRTAGSFERALLFLAAAPDVEKELRPVLSVMETCIPSDCWRAATLYGELYSGRPETDSKRPPFGSVEGRDLLADIAFDDGRLEEDRLRALDYLAMRCTLWPYPDAALPRIARVDRQEADALIRKATPLLRAKTERVREPAVRIIFQASHPRDGGLTEMETKSALPDLVEAYRTEPPGVVRDALAEAIRWIGGAAHWKTLTGNTQGTLITLYSFGRSGDEVKFWLNRVLSTEPVFECPTLVLSLLDEAGKPVSLQERPLPATYLPQPWEQGWEDGSGNIEVRFWTRGLAAGTWDVWVKGTTGLYAYKSPWRSEPKRFRLP